MATNINIGTLSTGYDVQVIGEYSPQLNCGICTLIIKHAMHGCTQHAFCKGCIFKYIECGIRTDDNVKCPGGCNIVINPSKLEPNHFADRMVNTLRTKCSNDNCPWQGDLLDLVQVHQTKCDYATQLCGNNGCSAKYLIKDAAQHQEVCLFQTIKCNYCCTDMIRMNMDTHEIECLNEEINCKYYDIGCMKQLCRKDIYQHEVSHQIQHMALMYQNLTHQNNKISVLKQQNATFNNEIIILKQQNITSNNENLLLKKKFEELEMKTNKEIAQLHQEFRELKKDNDGLLEKMKSLNNESSEIVVSKKLGKMKLKSEIFDIKRLKTKLSVALDMNEKVSLVNNDQVMIVKCNGRLVDLHPQELSRCYTNNKFDYLLELYGLNHRKDLMIELFDNIPYHWYGCQYDSTFELDFKLVFPLDLNKMNNILMDILIPGKCSITIINNLLMVKKVNKEWHFNNIYLHTCWYNIKLKYNKKYILKLLHTYDSCDDFSFAPGYGCLTLY